MAQLAAMTAHLLQMQRKMGVTRGPTVALKKVHPTIQRLSMGHEVPAQKVARDKNFIQNSVIKYGFITRKSIVLLLEKNCSLPLRDARG